MMDTAPWFSRKQPAIHCIAIVPTSVPTHMPTMAYAAQTQMDSLHPVQVEFDLTSQEHLLIVWLGTATATAMHIHYGILGCECIFCFHYCTVNDAPNGGWKANLSPPGLLDPLHPNLHLDLANTRNSAQSSDVKLSLPHPEAQFGSIQLTSITSGGATVTWCRASGGATVTWYAELQVELHSPDAELQVELHSPDAELQVEPRNHICG